MKSIGRARERRERGKCARFGQFASDIDFVVMLLYLSCPTSPSEWFIIELQGEVSAEGLGDDPKFSGITFADLSQIDV